MVTKAEGLVFFIHRRLRLHFFRNICTWWSGLLDLANGAQSTSEVKLSPSHYTLSRNCGDSECNRAKPSSWSTHPIIHLTKERENFIPPTTIKTITTGCNTLKDFSFNPPVIIFADHCFQLLVRRVVSFNCDNTLPKRALNIASKGWGICDLALRE